MDFKSMQFLVGVCVVLLSWTTLKVAKAQSPLPSYPTEISELRFMLRSALQQNRKLEQQNHRLKLVWSGIQQMCAAFDLPSSMCSCAPCNCAHYTNTNCIQKKEDVTPVPDIPKPQTATMPVVTTKTTTIPTPPVTTTQPATPPVTTATTTPDPGPNYLKVLSLKSGGLYGDNINVTIAYLAPITHTAEWLVLRTNGGMFRTNGERDTTPGYPYYSKTRLTIENINIKRIVLFRLYSGRLTLNMRLNLTAIEKGGNQVFADTKVDLLDFNLHYLVPIAADLNISAVLQTKPEEAESLSNADVFLTGLNTSTTPPEMFEITTFTKELIILSTKPLTNTTTLVTITLKHAIVKLGGILSFRFPKHIDGYVEQFFYGNTIKILSPTSLEIVPINNVGLTPLPKQTIVFPPSQSLMCAAIGNPRPEVHILKIAAKGAPVAMSTETLLRDSVSNMKVYNLNAFDKNQAEGTFICRAVSGNTTVDTMTVTVVQTPVVFDEYTTGVETNTSEKVVIMCTAYGVPRPILQIHLYDTYGPDLARTNLYKVDRFQLSGTLTGISLTMSPADTKIHSVHCGAIQGNKFQSRAPEVFKQIKVFPDTLEDWEFYNKVVHLVKPLQTP